MEKSRKRRKNGSDLENLLSIKHYKRCVRETLLISTGKWKQLDYTETKRSNGQFDAKSENLWQIKRDVFLCSDEWHYINRYHAAVIFQVFSSWIISKMLPDITTSIFHRLLWIVSKLFARIICTVRFEVIPKYSHNFFILNHKM